MISFIIPAHNEEALLGETLRSILAAAGEVGIPFEVFVVDDASTDRTSEVAREHGARVVRVEHRQIAATRNAGAAASQGDWLVFVDADTVVNAEVLQGAVNALQAGSVGGGARISFDGDAPWLVARLVKLFDSSYFAFGFAAGCFVFCNRDAFFQAGGFDESVYVSEEITLSRELRKLGRFAILPARVSTSARKLRNHSLGEMARLLLRLVFRGQKSFQSRDGLDWWYGPRCDR
ncbi:MAG: glycosyltransferase [Planctomycetales bacterium]|nr:glycosyltransferase [Planctomycetales bacterium]